MILCETNLANINEVGRNLMEDLDQFFVNVKNDIFITQVSD